VRLQGQPASGAKPFLRGSNREKRVDGKKFEINCDYVIGCDGFHGVSRQTIPENEIRTYRPAA
jgi:p-hydroxybenzoate 3-monooxygenase